ncbi:MAG: DUF4886 domain-containing protein [Bacteroidales bacterium]|nr:DUF4886 domain-containing protein [Bacteroidales bacterium]
MYLHDIPGDAAILRHLAIGGNAAISGSATIARNLKIEGWLDAKNIKGPCKGLFRTAQDLTAAHPYPLPGWWALVGEGLPAEIYTVDCQQWAATGQSWDFSTLDLAYYDGQIEEMHDAISRVESLFAPYIVNDGEVTIVTTTETVTREVEVDNTDDVIVTPGTTNLLDPDEYLYGYYITSGKIATNDNGIMSNKIYFEPGATYTIENVAFYSGKVFIAFYDASDNYIGRVGFEPTTTVNQGTNSSGTAYYGWAVLTTMVCPDTVEGLAFSYARIVLQAQGSTSATSITQVDLTQARVYAGTEWVEPTYGSSGGTHTETVTETVTHTQEVRGERLDLSGVCRCSESNGSTEDDTIEPALRILSIGNSYSRDSLAYMPYIIEEMAGIRVEVGILYVGNCTIDSHLYNARNANGSYVYDHCLGDGSAWVQRSGCSIPTVMAKEPWDVVLLQQASTSAYNANTYANLNELIDLLCGMTTKPVKFGWLLTQARPSTLSDEAIADNFLAAAEIAKSLLETSLIDFVVPVGTAIQNARATELADLGDGGNLVASDMVHLQEGLPCMLAAYASALSVADLCGRPYASVIGHTARATASWLSSKNIPEPNGDPIAATDAQYLLAQKCATLAHRHPYQIKNISS